MRKTRSFIFDAIRKIPKGVHDAGVTDKVPMREFDWLCLPPFEPLQPEEIPQIRGKSHVSQVVFAATLNTSLSTVQKWEIGQKHPTGAALKLLHMGQNKGLAIIA